MQKTAAQRIGFPFGWMLLAVCLMTSSLGAQDFDSNSTDNIRSYEIDRSYVVPTKIPEPELDVDPDTRVRHSQRPAHEGEPMGYYDAEAVEPSFYEKNLRRNLEDFSDNAVFDYDDEYNSWATKLGRGVVNICTGWLEFPRQIDKAVRDTDPFSGIVVGSLRGILWGVVRTGAGAYEMVTFPVAVPHQYEPIIEPEWIVKELWGQPLPIFSDPNNNSWEGMRSPGTPAFR